MKKCTALLLLLLSWWTARSQKRITYKQIDTIALNMDVYHAETIAKNIKSTAILFFFGGGWNTGSIQQLRPNAEYFSKRVATCFLVRYGVNEMHRTTPFESLKDAKTAMRYIKRNAERLNLDPSKIVAAGGSAGGQLAAATALIEKHNESADNLNISSMPNALILFNPVIDNGPGGYGYDRIGEAYKTFTLYIISRWVHHQQLFFWERKII